VFVAFTLFTFHTLIPLSNRSIIRPVKILLQQTARVSVDWKLLIDAGKTGKWLLKWLCVYLTVAVFNDIDVNPYHAKSYPYHLIPFRVRIGFVVVVVVAVAADATAACKVQDHEITNAVWLSHRY